MTEKTRHFLYGPGRYVPARERKTMKTIEDRFGQPIDMLLRERYIDKQESFKVIAEELDVAAGTVGKWLHKLGIPVRSVAEANRKK